MPRGEWFRSPAQEEGPPARTALPSSFARDRLALVALELDPALALAAVLVRLLVLLELDVRAALALTGLLVLLEAALLAALAALVLLPFGAALLAAGLALLRVGTFA